MKILVTGGSGYIGTGLVPRLAADPEIERVTVYDNLNRENYSFFLGEPIQEHKKVRFISGDILDSRRLKSVLQDTDVVYHLAAKVTTPFANTDPHFYEQVNHWGTAELVYALEESPVKKFIYTSSMSVYGSSKEYVNEQTVPNPRTFYGISKLRGEEHVMRLFDKIDTYILRCGNVYGYNKSMRFDAVINKFAFEANFNHKISIHGNGKQSRAFIHIDHITQIMHDILSSGAPSGIYNLFDKNLSILDIVDTLKEIYPELEFLFVNQHLSLRQLKADPESALSSYVDLKDKKTFKQEMEEFTDRFSF